MAERPGDGSSDQDMESGPVEDPPLLVSPHRVEGQQSTEQQRRPDDENKSLFKITLDSKLRSYDRIRPNDDVGTDVEVTPDEEVRLDGINVGDKDRPNKPIKSVVNVDSEAECAMQGDIFEAAQSGDVQTVKNYLDLGISPDLIDGQGWSILHHAASHGQVDVMRLLYSKGCCVDPRDRHGRTPLHHAASSGASASIGVLVEELGSEVNPVDEDGFTPLKRSVECEQYAVMKELLRCGRRVSFSGEDLKAVLFQAAKTGDTQHVFAILQSGRLHHSIDVVDRDGCNALHWAAECGAVEMIPFLIKCGLDVNRGNKTGVKALHVAAQYGHQKVVSTLVAAGCPIDVVDSNGCNALHYAASGGAAEMISFLIEGKHCFDVNGQGYDGYTPLHAACDSSQSQTACELLRHGALLTKVAGRYGTPLHLAAMKEDASFIDDIILKFQSMQLSSGRMPCRDNVYPESTNPLDVCDSFGRTPAFLAAGNGLLANLERFVANNCDIRVRSKIMFSMFENAIAGGRMSQLQAIASACRVDAGSTSQGDLLRTLQAKDLLDPSKLLILGAIGGDPLVIDSLSSEEDMFTKAAHQEWSDTYCSMLLENIFGDDNKDAIYGSLCLPSACPLTPLQIAVIFIKYRIEYRRQLHESEIVKRIVQTSTPFIQKLIIHPVSKFLINVQFHNGLSPLDVAQQFGLHDIADMIESAGGRPGMWADLPKEVQIPARKLYCSEYGQHLSSQGPTRHAALSRVFEGLVGVSPQLPATSVLVNQQTSADAVLHQRPTRKLLVKHVLPRVTLKRKWRSLYTLLDLEEEQVLKYHDQDDDDLYRAVLFAWLEHGSQVSWERLFDAVGTFETEKTVKEMRAKVLEELQPSAVTSPPIPSPVPMPLALPQHHGVQTPAISGPAPHGSREGTAEESTPVLSDRDFLPYLDLMIPNILILGVSLGIGVFTEGVLNSPGRNDSQCLQVVREWLRRTQEPTWSVFCEQLKGVQCFKHLVHEIERNHSKELPPHHGVQTPAAISGPAPHGSREGHESVLLDKCFIPFGIKTVQIDQSGGVYCLEPTTDGVEDPHSDHSEQQRSEDDDSDEGTGTPRKIRDFGEGREEENRFKIEVPDGALKQKFLEVRSAIIFSGPWRLPKGYTLASPVLYISFDFTAVTKPIIVRVPHWIAQVKSLSAKDCPLAIAPHELPEDDSEYSFSFLDQEDCSVSARHSTIKLSEHCCLLTQLAIKELESKGQLSYSATAWTRPRDRQSGFIFRVPVTFDLPSWHDVLEKYLKHNKWTKHDVLPIDFKFKAEAPNEASLSGTLTEDSGPGWTASLNREKIPQSCVRSDLEEQSLEHKLKRDAYPPSFAITVNYELNDCEQYTQSGSKTKKKQVNLVVSGNDSESIKFAFEVEEAVHLSETGSVPSLLSPPTASRNGSTKEAPMARMGDKIDSSFDIFRVEEYSKGLIVDMTILGAVLGIGAEAKAIINRNGTIDSQLLEILNVYIARASPTWGDFCTALEKYHGFNKVRVKIQRDHNYKALECT